MNPVLINACLKRFVSSVVSPSKNGKLPFSDANSTDVLYAVVAIVKNTLSTNKLLYGEPYSV